MKRILYIIRGLPGSGKSTLAQNIATANRTDHWYEADMYFEGPQGYKWEASHISDAHAWCQDKVWEAMKGGASIIVVSNTFTTNKEMKPYIDMAESWGYTVQVIECQGQFGSIHGVPNFTVSKMAKRWEAYQPRPHLPELEAPENSLD